MPESVAFTVLKAATIVSSIGLFASPAPDLLSIHRSKAVGEVSVFPLVSMFGCGFIWVVYGILINNIFPVVITNVLGVLASSFYISVYLYHMPARRDVLTLLAWVALGLAGVMIYADLGASGITGLSNKQTGKVVGFVAVAVNIVLYGSPFETIAKVLRTKSVSSLPIALCLVAMLNCTLWALYGILDNDMFVLTPNAIGLVFSVVQVALYVKFRPSPQPTVGETEHSGLMMEPSSETEFAETKSPTSVAVHLPLVSAPEYAA